MSNRKLKQTFTILYRTEDEKSKTLTRAIEIIHETNKQIVETQKEKYYKKNTSMNATRQ